MTLHERALIQLGGCAAALVSDTPRGTWMYVSALMTCERHGGVHHLAIVNEGRTVLVSVTALECLRDQGVRL